MPTTAIIPAKWVLIVCLTVDPTAKQCVKHDDIAVQSATEQQCRAFIAQTELRGWCLGPAGELLSNVHK